MEDGVKMFCQSGAKSHVEICPAESTKAIPTTHHGSCGSPEPFGSEG